ncbi:lysosomal-associated transmembrane protein 5 [Discoglossus pictus]
MAPKSTERSQASSCVRVRAVVHTLSIYHMIMAAILFIEHSAQVISRKSCCPEISKYYYVVDVASSYLLLFSLFVISILLLWGVLKKRGSLAMPFLALQIMDFILSCLMLLSTYVVLPSYLGASTQDTMLDAQQQAQNWKALDICLSLLTLCSFYVEVPAYLNLKSMNLMNYFPHNDSQKYVTELVAFNLLYVAVLFFKVFLIWCVYRVFKSFQLSKKPKSPKNPMTQDFSKVKLPSYEEAVKIATKDCPPPYSSV